RRRHTRCLSDWSSDVCSSDLLHLLKKEDEATKLIAAYRIGQFDKKQFNDFYQPLGADSQYVAILAREFPDRMKKLPPTEFEKAQIGRASCRERVKSTVDTGGV